MIDWLFQATIETSLIVTLVLILRNPVRRIFGANITYWLWVLPLLKLITPNQIDRPDVISRYIDLPNSNDLLPVYSSPTQVSGLQVELVFWIWLIGLVIYAALKYVNARKYSQLLCQDAYSDTGLPEDVMYKWFMTGLSVKFSPLVSSPIINGLIKPVIYLPQNFKSLYSATQQRLVIQHEITHARRLDLWMQLIFECYQTIFWFNPLVHLAGNKFKEDQELSCDYLVLKKATSNERIEYGKALQNSLSAVLIPNSLTFFYHKHERFIMLSKHKKNTLLTLIGIIFLAFVGYMVITKKAVTFEEKSVETHGGIVSYDFKEIPLETVAMLVSDATGGVTNLQGLDLLQGINITAKAEKVYAFDFFDALLKDNGLRVIRSQDSWQFKPL